MRFLVLLLVAAICEARPSIDSRARPALFQPGFGSFIVGGTEATPGEFPWQLSQQRLGAAWSHSCGASLLSADRALSAAHCVVNTNINILRVIGGLHDRTASNGEISNLSGMSTHAGYNNGQQTFANDIAILNLETPIFANGDSIGYATLPDDTNDNQYTGETCVMSGWGRTSSSNALPNNLMKASIGVISMDECNTRMAPVSGANVGPGQICLFSSTQNIGSCNGDSGGPLNCDDQSIVAGVTSWGISGGGACLQTYPSVYTRTSYFRQWIRDNSGA